MHKLLFLIFLFAGSFQLAAQKLSVPNSSTILSTLPSPEFLFQDEEEKILFVDFQKVHSEFNRIEILNVEGELIFEKNIEHLANSAIFEIDYKNYLKGKYTLKLRSPILTEESNFDVL